MGRPKKQQKHQQQQQQKCSTKSQSSSSVIKRSKDHSKQSQLREKCVSQKLSSPLNKRSTKLNAVMQLDPTGGRKRVTRNPVAMAEQQQDSSSSPTDADSSNEAGAGAGSSGISNECRRSSRKKTIKFDVRDLLNKNRKNHKIQIEARIDSNEPKVGAGQVSKAELDSKQKTFIEKSAIFRRYSISENKLPPRPPPPPGALIHTIQQCVGELEQLPLDGGELNLAAITPIARRLSRTQDIITASMIKPKQVSSLIVTKLESTSTSKGAAASNSNGASSSLAKPATNRFVGCEPSTSGAAIVQKKRGRKAKAKLFAESTTESSSSSNDCFESLSKQISAKTNEKYMKSEDSSSDGNSTTCIDLKEDLDASAVTLPQPRILDNCMNNSTDDSLVATDEEIFTARNHSSDESTTGSLRNSSNEQKSDEISLFGRSNSTETNSSEDSEKRRRKIRISVKRVSLTPQKSPLALTFPQITEPIEVLSSTNDENSNEGVQMKTRKGKQAETCATPPIILLESDTSNAASVSSSVIEIASSSGTPIPVDEIEPPPRNKRREKLIQKVLSNAALREMSFKPVQKSPQTRQRSSSRISYAHLPVKKNTANSPRDVEDDISLNNDDDLARVADEVKVGGAQASILQDEKESQSVQNLGNSISPSVSTKRQRKGRKVKDVPTEHSTKVQEEVNHDSSGVLPNSISLETDHCHKDPAPECEEQNKVHVSETKQDESIEMNETMNQSAPLSDVTELEVEPQEVIISSDRKDDLKSEEDSTTDSLSTDSSAQRRESLRLRSNVLPKPKKTSKKTSKPTINSNNPDAFSENSEINENSTKNCSPSILENVIDDKSKEETSSLCSESSFHSSSASSSLSSSSKGATSSSTSSKTSSSASSSPSSPSSSPSSSSSSSSEGSSKRSPRLKISLKNSSLEKIQKDARRSKSPSIDTIEPKTQSPRSDRESPENIQNDINSSESEKLMRRKSVRLKRSSSEPERDLEECENSNGNKQSSELHQTLDETTPQKENETENNDNSSSQTPTKSKKRSRRFVPIKYSSSESSTLSDDGNTPGENSSVRLTRTRRKTISSASDFEEITGINLSPPDLALEYTHRKAKQTDTKVQEPSEKTNTEEPREKEEEKQIETELKNEEKTEEVNVKAKRKPGRPKKENKDEPSSPTISDSGMNRERKVTRLSLKNQNTELKTNESLNASTESENLIPEKCEPVLLAEKTTDSNQLPLDNETKNDKETTENKEELDDKKGTKISAKSPGGLKNKKDYKDKFSENENYEIDKENEKDEVKINSDIEVSQIIPEIDNNSKEDSDKFPKSSDTMLPTIEIKSQDDDNLPEKNKDGVNQDTSEPKDQEKLSQTEKVVKESDGASTLEIPAEQNEEKVLNQDKNSESLPLDVEKADHPAKPTRRRKPTRFSKALINDDSKKAPEIDTAKEVDLSSQFKKSTRSSPKCSDQKEIQVKEQEEPISVQPPILESSEPLTVAETEVDTSLKSITEPTNEALPADLKITETPKRRRKPTRFSPRSPENNKKEETESGAILKPLTDENIEEIPSEPTDETKKPEESANTNTTTSEATVKSPRVRKGIRFAPKTSENIETPSEETAKHVDDKQEPSENLEVSKPGSQVKPQEKPAKQTRSRKGARFVTESSEILRTEDEVKKTLNDSPINEVSSSDVNPAETPTPSEPLQTTKDDEKIDEKKTEREDTMPVEVQDEKVKDPGQYSTTSEFNSATEERTNVVSPNDVQQVSDSHPQEERSPEETKSVDNNMSSALEKSSFPTEVDQNTTNLSTEEDKIITELAVDKTLVTPSPEPETVSKKGIKKQLKSMLGSLKSMNKTSTPRGKKKQQASTAAQGSATKMETDEPVSIENVVKMASSDSNLEEITKFQGQSSAPDETHPPNQPDSIVMESLEKPFDKPVSSKKKSTKKEKDNETPQKPLKENSKKTTNKKPQEPSESALKKTESPSPNLKKKHNKDSPKLAKKNSEEQTSSKRKSIIASKSKESEVPAKPIECKLPENGDSINKQSIEVVKPPIVLTQPLKTKAETKFYSPEKPIIQSDPLPPSIAIIEKPDPPPAVAVAKEKSPDLVPDPLKDIEKFIEDGVNLLKRSYKIDADDDSSLDRDALKTDEIMTPKKCKLEESIVEEKLANSPPHDDNSNSNSESSTITTNTTNSDIDTPNGIRRSHRIKNNSKSTKCLVGRGLVRERERFSTKDDEKTIYSINDQKMDLAEVEAKNSKFLKDMEERLSNFRVIRENEYKCERVISKEAKRMLCDCFLTQEEEERGELGCGEDCLNRLLMIECGTDCTVRDRCTNRRFNKFLYSPCRVFRTEKKGFGIMADIEILPGEFIMEYVGEVINGDEFEFRINEYSKDKNKHYYFMALRSDAVIDATAKGNISRFINHSCDPNAETQKWTVNGELRIGFFSRKSIMPGEEITFDYQYQRYGKEAQKCYCESANCRGWIGAEPSSEEEEEYEGVEEEDESEESEEEEPSDIAVAVPVVPSPMPLTVEQPLVAEQPLVSAIASEVSVPAVENIPSLISTMQPITAPEQLAEPLPPKVSEKPKELPPKKKKEKKQRLLEEKLKRREPKQFLEDPDIEDEVRFLVKCGLRNQADTLRLSRLIVRAKLLETRIHLLQILRQGELPCRRLFLDYHGLRLLHGWMSEVLDTQDTEKSMEIRMELLSALESLPISNKTMLTDSKVYQTVRDWSNNKESHSPSEGSPKESSAITSSTCSTPPSEDVSCELQKLAAKLVHTWDNLPEVFRIPKRERIEQMKEHEREADRQYKVLERGLMSGSSNNRERFKSKSGRTGRFQWSKEKERERINERRKYAQNNSSRKDGVDKSAGPLAEESHLSKEQRRELFAAKVARDEAEKRQAEERREFDIKCRFFGLDPKRIRPENMPFCVNPSTGQWYSCDKKPILTPPSYAHVQVPVKPKSTNPEDYRLPKMDLPPLWKFAISPKGKIYYYHVKIRIPQWEPPIKILPLAGQHDSQVKSSESDSSTAGVNDSSEDDIEVIKGLDPVKLQAYIEKKIEGRRLQRYNRLVEEKSISPRKEEDRIYNQMEVRKYKENKEKIRKRKEEIRRRRDNIVKQQVAAALESANASETTEASETAADALPIQDYLLSSEEEEVIKAECNNSPLIDKIVQGDKIVDELDALQRKRSLKRALPIRDKYEHKKRKVDKNKDSSKSTKRNKDGEGTSSSSSKYRKVREKFRCDIAGIIVQHLKPYRSESCTTGKILTDDDFNHLARKLTHFVMVKELKYCESIGQTLIVTESVKNKSREFIKKYMAKYGKVYVRPTNDPEFKDIPFL